MHRTDKYSQHSSIIWLVWLNGWVFVYELSGCGFESRCCHLIATGLSDFHKIKVRVWETSFTKSKLKERNCLQHNMNFGSDAFQGELKF